MDFLLSWSVSEPDYCCCCQIVLQIQSKTRTRYIAQRDRDSPSNQAGTKRRITLVRGTRGQYQQPYIAASCKACKASRRPKLRTAPQNTVLRLLIGDCGCQGCTPGFMNVSVFRHVTSASQANFVAARVRLPSSWRCRQAGGLRIQTHTSIRGRMRPREIGGSSSQRKAALQALVR